MAMSITPSETDTIRINIENLTDEDYYPYSHSTHQVTVGESANLRLSYNKSF
jgi:catecholate siderophore receptor